MRIVILGEHNAVLCVIGFKDKSDADAIYQAVKMRGGKVSYKINFNKGE